MTDLFEYISENAEKGFDEMPFNDVDSLIFSRLSYFDFSGFEGLRLGEIFDDYVFGTESKYSKKLLYAVSIAPRYSNVRVYDFMSAVDDGIKFCFCACTLELSPHSYYISFAGTVKNIASVYEDASMAYCYPVESEKLAFDYVDKICGKDFRGKYRIGGHSKGGSFALYAYFCSKKEIKDKITDVYNFDGPGLPFDIKPFLDESDISKIHVILPRDSVIGRIYDNRLESDIVKSRSFFIYQHNPFRWSIKNNEFVRLDGFTPMSRSITKLVDRFMNKVDSEQLKYIGDGISVAAKSAGIKSDDELRQIISKLSRLAITKAAKD